MDDGLVLSKGGYELWDLWRALFRGLLRRVGVNHGTSGEKAVGRALRREKLLGWYFSRARVQTDCPHRSRALSSMVMMDGSSPIPE